MMKQELEDTLHRDHGDIFQNVLYGVECGDGWYNLIDELCCLIELHAKYHPKMPDVVARQVKEKFGGLRFYIDGGDDYVRGMVREAEKESFKTCEECGTTEHVGQTEGYTTTICRACAEEQGRLELWEPNTSK